jgi:hypothetical protein
MLATEKTRPDRPSLAPPPVSAVRRLGWQFTALGRVRHRLWDAARDPESPARARLADDLEALRGRADAASADLAREILVFLTRASLEEAKLDDAATHLGELDTRGSDAAERCRLRCDLLDALRGSKPGGDVFRHQLSVLVRDQAAGAEPLRDAILADFAALYEHRSPEICLSVLEATAPELARDRRLQALRALCACPVTFERAEQAREWVRRISITALAFHATLEAEATLVAARAAEWAGEFDRMLRDATRAAELAPARPSCQYWLRRARLHAAASIDEAVPGPHGSEAEARLACLVTLKAAGTLASAEPAVRLLERAWGTPEAPEARRGVELLAAALRFDSSRPIAEEAQRATLCERLQRAVGRLPWAEVAIAVKQIRIDRAYAAAAARLATPEVAGEPHAHALAWACRMLDRDAARPTTNSPLAGQHMAELDRVCSDWPERAMIRAQLLEQLRVRGHFDEFATQAAAWLRDPLIERLVDRAAEYRRATAWLIETVYVATDRARRASVLGEVRPGIARLPDVRAAASLVRCPDRFASPAEARSWHDRVDPAALAFSPRMQVDALIVGARAAEWCADLDAMEARAQDAAHLLPDHVPAAYWLARARLRRPSGADDELPVLPSPAPPEWVRLAQLRALRRAPTLSNARALLQALARNTEPLETPESELCALLLASALEANPERSAEETSEIARLCEQAARLLDVEPWMEVGIAAAAIRCDGDCATALERLEAPPVARHIAAWPWIAAARLLSGLAVSPHAEMRIRLFEAADTALAQLASRTPPAPQHARALAAELRAAAATNLWCRALPALSAIAAGLAWSFDALARLADDDRKALALPDVATAPEWLRWLVARIALLGWNGDRESFPAVLASDVPVVAWQVDAAWALYGPAPDPERGTERLGLPPGEREVAGASIAAALPRADRAAADACVAIRAAAAARDLALAARIKSQLAALDAGPFLVAALWRPALAYLHATRIARSRPAEAEHDLRHLLSGPKAADARGQLALLAMQRKDLAAAEQWLAGIEPRSPGIAYACALLASRTGRTDEAVERLDALERTTMVSTPYTAAARRLRAAIEERAGRAEDATQRYRALVAASPDDAVARARLGRLLVQQRYARAASTGGIEPADEATDIPNLLGGVTQTIGWCQGVLSAHALLSPLTGAARPAEHQATTAAWRVLAAFQQSASGHPAEAAKLLGAPLPGDESALRRSSTMLRTLAVLRTLGAAACRPDLKARANGLDELRGELAICVTQFLDPADAAAPATFHGIARLATWANHALDGADAGSLAELRRQLSASQVSCLAGLFSTDAAERQPAVEAIAAAMSGAPATWDADQRAVLRAVIAAERRDDDELLAAYAELAPRLDRLAIRGADLWFAAARIWYRRKTWQVLLHDDLPAAVADLEDPRVRLLIGLAYAAQVVEAAAREDTRKASQELQRARSTLSALCQEA